MRRGYIYANIPYYHASSVRSSRSTIHVTTRGDAGHLPSVSLSKVRRVLNLRVFASTLYTGTVYGALPRTSLVAFGVAVAEGT